MRSVSPSKFRLEHADSGTFRYRRSVICHYEDPATTKGLAEARGPDLVLVPPTTTTLSPGLKNREHNVLGDAHPSNRAFFMLNHSLSPSLVVPTTLDGIFHLRVCEIFRAYGKFVDDVTVRYFKGVHRWLPIISRSRFHDCLVGSQSSIVADFSVLLLSMCLITHKPVRTLLSNSILSEIPTLVASDVLRSIKA